MTSPPADPGLTDEEMELWEIIPETWESLSERWCLLSPYPPAAGIAPSSRAGKPAVAERDKLQISTSDVPAT
jgi:hypothetical protein